MSVAEQLLIAFLAITPNVVIDKNEPYWSQDGWSVYAYDAENMCDIGVANEKGQYMTIGCVAKENAMTFAVSNAAATSLTEGQKVKLTVAILGRGLIMP